MMTGGVARNKGIIQALEEKLGAKLYICDEAQLCGALGGMLMRSVMRHGDQIRQVACAVNAECEYPLVRGGVPTHWANSHSSFGSTG